MDAAGLYHKIYRNDPQFKSSKLKSDNATNTNHVKSEQAVQILPAPLKQS